MVGYPSSKLIKFWSAHCLLCIYIQKWRLKVLKNKFEIYLKRRSSFIVCMWGNLEISCFFFLIWDVIKNCCCKLLCCKSLLLSFLCLDHFVWSVSRNWLLCIFLLCINEGDRIMMLVLTKNIRRCWIFFNIFTHMSSPNIGVGVMRFIII